MARKRILRTPAASEYTSLSVSTLEKRRQRGEGPPFVRLGGRAIGYDIDDLDAWLDKQKEGHNEREPLSPPRGE
jgi:predicted DNA-binding transcriptional regulator AlpA